MNNNITQIAKKAKLEEEKKDNPRIIIIKAKAKMALKGQENYESMSVENQIKMRYDPPKAGN